tara:strand:- start:1230 stop:1460 length:231 start_codon:yes stop_codon:yes gene_type:complete
MIYDYEGKPLPWYFQGGRDKSRQLKKDRDNYKVKFCETCNNAWETERYDNSKILKHEDFPLFGLKKEECPPCSRNT